ncbi:MAG TPA: UvrD-helicase domain-containing protein [Arachnia sp.]|nr:UvrD-helicase domain-containing protein [Arachnia sp.]
MSGSPFDLTGPLPRRTTLLEASAGTGKTYAIAALAARYLAEDGLDAGQLLLITFGRHATGELRSRVFERLTSTVRALDEVLAGGGLPDPTDAVAAHLASWDVDLHRSRLADAVARFNELTILTTHSFCQAMLHELGILGDWDPAEEVGADPMDLVRQCAADTYLRLHRTDPQPPLLPQAALRIGEAACTTTLDLLPPEGPHHHFAQAVRGLYEERKAAEGVCTYNDVITRLLRLTRADGSGEAVVAELRRRFSVVLIDEFQDTDPEQWAIVEQAFVSEGRATILIGDPKQSIYAFRGADLQSYLDAKEAADVHTLAVNRRSDKALVDGVLELFEGVSLGHESVAVGPVTAHEHEPRLQLPGPHRLWLRTATPRQLGPQPAAAAIDQDLVVTVQNLVSRAEFTRRAEPRVRYSDIAILVRRGARARELRAVLEGAGIPAVLTGSQSVWTQPAARDWAALLTAMSDPAQATIRLAALTALLGSRLGALLDPASSEPARVSTLVRTLGLRFTEGGISSVLSHLRTAEGLDERLLAEPDGERELADLLHVAELLDAGGATSLSGLLAVLDERAADEDSGDAIRVASDEEAVRVMTIHAAKGLEFPIVLLPETDGVKAVRSKPFTLVHEGRRHLYVGPVPRYDDPLARTLDDQSLTEELRLLYVGFTRAQHFCVAWHVETSGKQRGGPLGTLLRAWERRRRGAVTGTAVSRTEMDPQIPPPKPSPPAPRSAPALELAVLARDIDTTWRRTSYSGLTQGLHEQAAAHVLTDEATVVDVALPIPAGHALAAPSPMTGLPAGAAFGTLAHEALERLAWAPDSLESSAAAVVAELGPQHALDPVLHDTLSAALVAVCRTPLLPLSAAALTDIPTAQRLPELDFDLPLADRGAPATLRMLADLMAAHLPSSDPLVEYPQRLRSSDAADSVLNGFLTGSIDAVLQLADGRFLVVDYKTNRLAPAGEAEVTVGHYVAPAMAEAMMQAHYPLQAILYCVALHRYLSTRLPGYAPERHLGGVGYLFVRGMAGPTTPVVEGTACGVMAWRPAADLVVAASELLGGTHA